jgi:hypothetical protein
MAATRKTAVTEILFPVELRPIYQRGNASSSKLRRRSSSMAAHQKRTNEYQNLRQSSM